MFTLWHPGGCIGNTNRFETKDFCEAACKFKRPGRPKTGPIGSVIGDRICNLPLDLGIDLFEIQTYLSQFQ